MVATDPLQEAPATPWLSVLVPAYNAADHIETCLHSVLAQGKTSAGIELLVLDDASTDATRSVVARIATEYPQQVRLLSQPTNAGISAARNRLLAEARGRHLWFLDADDVLLPGALEGLHGLLAQHDPDLVLCDFRYLRGDRFSRLRCTCHARPTVPSSDRARLVAATLDAGELHVWSKIARRELWQRVDFPVGRHFEDISGTCQLLRHVSRWLHAHQAWVGYRQHPRSIMATLTPTRLDEWVMALLDTQRLANDPAITTDPAAIRAAADFRLRNLASALRRAERLPTEARDTARAALADAGRRLFPHGTAGVLRDWLRRGWWLRAARTHAALRRARLA